MLKIKKINWWLIGVLLTIFLLRLPSFFEPYWYGDEGIYLALGQAMQRGAVLYRDIWDNKPPLLYIIYAIIPTLLWAKITATAFVLGTCYTTYVIARNVVTKQSNTIKDCFALLAMTLTGIFLSIPLLEGTIANAELYFTLPIIIAAYLILKNKFQPLIIGSLLAIAFLIKVPAVFDFAGLFLAYLIIHKKLKPLFLTSIPLVVSLVLLFIYFYINHGLNDFIIAAFSQNSSYVSVASGPLSKLTNPLFVKGIILLFGSLVLFVLFIKKIISKELLILSTWFGFSIYGSLLSGRPYMHYLLQIIPPLIILLTYVIASIAKQSSKVIFIVIIFIIFVLTRMFTGAFFLPIKEYYQNWFDYVSERKIWEDYTTFFDSRTLNSYAVSEYLATRTQPLDPIFVWGDAAFVYVLSNRPPATKFIQSHHLTTINPRNYDLAIEKLKNVKPKFILVSRPGHFSFPKLEELIKQKYTYVATFQDLYVYQILK